MNSLELERDKKLGDNITKNFRNLFILKKEMDDNTRIIGDIMNLSKQEGEDYYKPVTLHNFYKSNYTEYESNDDRNKTLSI